MATNYDSRGLSRGRCLVCSCVEYDGSSSGGMKCACRHPPGKHVNMKLPGLFTALYAWVARDGALIIALTMLFGGGGGGVVGIEIPLM